MISVRNKGRKIVIIGNGIAGITCARNIRKIDSSAIIIVISGESEHFFSRTALMYLYMGHMKYEHIKPYEDWFWGKNRIELVHAWVTKVDFQAKEFALDSGSKMSYDLLILATGSKPNKFGWPGQDLKGVQGLYSKQDLELMERNTKGIKHAVVVGGGLIGIEMAEMLSSRDIPVTFLVREAAFWDIVLPKEEAEMVERHMREHHIDLRLNTELKEIIDDGMGKVKAVLTDGGETIPCQFVGLTTGVSPNTGFFKGTPLEINRGIVVDEFFSTSIDHVFAIGDCAEFKKAPGPNRKEIEQVWYTGRMHGETLAYTLTVKPVPYRPGVWFNSAKFFDIEYQTYGTVPNKITEGISSFYWEHENGRICFRAVFDTGTNIFIGANALGFRLRHVFMDKAIKEGWEIDQVMENLYRADFNPEFYQNNQESILEKYNRKFGKNIPSRKRGWWSNWLKKVVSSS
ncbi:MAG: FAD-dependent oxidoreductase [Anditalea sp.]